MCLILLAKNVHPDYKLIIAANRDEFYNRSTQPAHFWENKPDILAGKDLEAGGSWMGLNKYGNISMLTNYRDIENIKEKAPSRGHLVTDFLQNSISPTSYLTKVEDIKHEYNGFNLIVGNPNDLYYLSNYSDEIIKIKDGVHGLSNSTLNVPWYKVRRGVDRFNQAITIGNISEEKVFEALYDEQLAPDKELPQTGLSYSKEKAISSMFIKTPDYGTRCSTVILVNNDNTIFFRERSFNTKDFTFKDRSFTFKA